MNIGSGVACEFPAGDTVGGFSLRLQLNQDERWTKALKHLLIDMKWMLEYIERKPMQLIHPALSPGLAEQFVENAGCSELLQNPTVC